MIFSEHAVPRTGAEWDDDNVEHIARHHVEPEEVEEIVYEDCYPSWIMRVRRRGVHETRWRLYGQTCAGRYLIVVAAPYRQKRSMACGDRDGNGSPNSTEI